MTTSNKNKVSPETRVTPDCVVQNSETTGYIAELKLGLPKDTKNWSDLRIQLVKYDDELQGWWTADERLAGHEVLVLVPFIFTKDVGRELRKRGPAGAARLERSVVVVGYGIDRGQIGLQRQSGSLLDKELNRKLSSIRCPLHRSVVLTGDRKFLDYEPPLPFMLQVIWNHAFTWLAGEQGLRPGDKKPLAVRLDELKCLLQRNWGFSGDGARSVEIPREKWVRKALDALVAIDMATKVDELTFRVRFGPIRGDVLKYFGHRLARATSRARPAAEDQPSLPYPEPSLLH